MAKAAVTFIMIHIMGLTFLYLLVEPLSVDAMLVAGALFAMSAWGLVTSVKNSSRSSRTVRAESAGRLHMSAPLSRRHDGPEKQEARLRWQPETGGHSRSKA